MAAADRSEPPEPGAGLASFEKEQALEDLRRQPPLPRAWQGNGDGFCSSKLLPLLAYPLVSAGGAAVAAHWGRSRRWSGWLGSSGLACSGFQCHCR